MRKVLLLLAFPLFCIAPAAYAQFCPGAAPWVFDDVPVGDPFCGYITWAAQNGITLGCAIIDANHRLYCPSEPVRREQMAAFVNRLGNVRVEAVGTGPGLTGGPITGIGTINLATTQLLPTTACANSQIARWNGSAWVCSSDADSGGTVTSVASGTGLTGGPITASGTLSILAAYQLPQGCTNGQVAKSNGSNAWTCASDANSGGTVTSITAGSGLTGGTITTSGTIAVDPTSSTLTGNFFRQGGNAFGGTAVLGTTDNNAIDVRVNASRVMRYEPRAVSPNIVGGHPGNSAANDDGQAVLGGGSSGNGCWDPIAGLSTGTCNNASEGGFGVVAGGRGNLTVSFGAIGGGASNRGGSFSTIPGGFGNIASGASSSIGGGDSNTASGSFAAVPGGTLNQALGIASFAAGRNAQASHDGAFAWSDTANFPFVTSAANEFAARATGGVRFVTAIDGGGSPLRTVKINTNGELDFGSQARQMLNLWGPSVYGIGVQTATLYSRTSQFFAWFMSGVHSDSAYDPGLGGQVLATLQTGASATTVTGTFRAQAFTATSDRNAKVDFALADGAEVLDKVASLPIATWSYLNEQASGIRHIGPTAQDFKERFGVGYDDKTIATVDADGVALAAIQGLNAKVESQARELDAQRAEIAELRRAVAALLAR